MNGRGASLFVMVLVTVSTFSIVITVLPENARGNILYVGGPGPGNYTTIQSAVDAAFPGDTVFVYNGTYVENVVVYKTLNLTGEDRNTTIIDADRAGDALLITADWVNVTEFTTMFTGFAVVGRAGIKLDSVEHCYIADNNPSHTNWYGISLLNAHNNTIANNTNLSDNMHGIRLFSSHYNIVTNNNITYTYGSGVGLVSSDNNTIVGNRLVENDHGVDLLGSHNNTISNTVVGNWLDGIDIDYSKNNRIINNTIMGNWGPGIDISDSGYNLIKDNVLHDNNWFAIDMWYSHNMHITNNTMTNNSIYIFGYDLESWNTHVIDTFNTVEGKPVYYWKNITGGTIPSGAGQVILANTTNIIVENQNLSRGAAGILLGYSSDGTITNISSWDNWYGNNLYQSHYNTFTNISGSDSGSTFYLYYSDNNTFINVNSSSTYEGVIRTFDSTNSTIKDCTLHSSETDGLQIVRSFGDVITNNTILSNDRWGIGMGSSNSTVTNNTLLGNGLGITVGSSSYNNSIHHNNLINNTVQASDTSSNFWDDGYPSGGNYWSDYSGTDNKSGPNQDQPGSDGIGDTPYNITGGSNKDQYPLMNGSLPPNLRAPSAPISLTAIPGNAQVNLSWNPPLDDGGLSVRNYRIYRGNSSGGETFHIEIGDVYTYADTSLTNGQTYFYQISAVNAVGEGPLSNEANATPKTPPGSPGMIGADLTGFWYEDVTVTWALSSDDGAGQNSVVSYEIYRNMTFDPDGLGYGLLASVANGTTSYTDMWAGEPDMDSYFYRICALDKFGIESCSGTQASKFTRYIMRGMNLVSFPVIPANDDSATTLQTVYHDESWIYDSLSKTWRSSVAMKPYSQSPGPVNNTMGMWIDVTFGSNFTVAGVVPDQTAIQLMSGWNLVGFPSFSTTYTVSDLKAETGATRVEGYDSSSPPYFLKPLQTIDLLKAGEGYWIYVPADVVWTVYNS